MTVVVELIAISSLEFEQEAAWQFCPCEFSQGRSTHLRPKAMAGPWLGHGMHAAAPAR